MKTWRRFAAFALALPLLLVTQPGFAEEEKPAGWAEPPGFARYSSAWDKEEHQMTLSAIQTCFKVRHRKYNLYPAGQLGVIVSPIWGIEGLVVSGVLDPPSGSDLRGLDPRPRNGLELLDRIISVNGQELGVSDDFSVRCGIQLFGEELNKAEALGSPLRLQVERAAEKAGEKGKVVEMVIPVKARGAFDPQKPHLGKKADLFREIALKRLVGLEAGPGARESVYGPDVWKTEYGTYMAGLALLSTGDEEALKACGYIAARIRQRFTEQAMVTWGLNQWTWHTAMATVFLAEYYWATGDLEAFEQLEKMADFLATYVNPAGGVGHKKLKGTYRQLSFSPAAGLTVLGLTMAEKCGVAVDREALEKALAYYKLPDDPDFKPNAVSYGGTLVKRPPGQWWDGAFRTAVYVSTLSLLERHPERREAMLDWLASIPHHLTSTHSSPTHGEFFTALVLASERPADYAALLRHRIFSLTVSLDHNEIFEYMPPVNIGKTKGADVNLGFAQMANARPLVFLNGYRRNILLTGTEKPLGWRGHSPVADPSQRHLARIHRVLDRHLRAMKEGEWVEARDWLRFIERRYLHPGQKVLPEKEVANVKKQVSRLRKQLEQRPGWQAALTEIRDREARTYLTWRLMIRPNCGGILQEFQETHGESRFATQVAELSAKLEQNGKGEEGMSKSYLEHFDLVESLTKSEPDYFLAELNFNVIVPTSEREGQEWRYTTEVPDENWTWTLPDFDDSAWKTGKGMFGTKGTPAARIETKWETEHICLRRSFDLEKIPAEPALRVLNDDIAWVYLNGKRVIKLQYRNTEYINSPIYRSSLREGRNVIAVRCLQSEGGQVIDVGIVEIEKVTDEGSAQ